MLTEKTGKSPQSAWLDEEASLVRLPFSTESEVIEVSLNRHKFSTGSTEKLNLLITLSCHRRTLGHPVHCSVM